MSSEVTVSIYHRFNTDDPPFYQTNDFGLRDSILLVHRRIYRIARFITFDDVIFLFDVENTKRPLDVTTLLSTLVSSNNTSDK